MGDYEICVKEIETYIIHCAKSKTDAIKQAIDCFKDDDMYYGSEEAENVTENDCEVIWFEGY